MFRAKLTKEMKSKSCNECQRHRGSDKSRNLGVVFGLRQIENTMLQKGNGSYDILLNFAAVFVLRT